MDFLRFLVLLTLCTPMASNAHDSDNDGLHDVLEQELLQRFAPEFLVSGADCDGFPAEFQPGFEDPRLIDRNGTIYGQVRPVQQTIGSRIEIHYFHLWNRDCGLNGHPLDAEHVSVLISAPSMQAPAAAWKAEYWYAAAHEDTVCDASHAARSTLLNAETHGPKVWIAAGKHASYLHPQLCGGGCGSDDCVDSHPLAISRIVNLGEANAPANGADWLVWPGWPLAAKMQTDFPEHLLAKINEQAPDAIVPAHNSRTEIKTALSLSGSTAGALISADHKRSAALKKSTAETGSALRRAGRAVWRALRLSRERLPK